MPEQVKAPVIPKISEQMTPEKRDNVTAAIKTAMERAKDPNRAMEGTESWEVGKRGWEEHVGDSAPLATSMLESQLTDRRPSIWQIACLFNNADPDRILQHVGKEDRQLVLDLLGETADKAWGADEAAKLETDIYDGSGLFDPGRLPIDFFGITAEAIKALRKEKLLPEPLAAQVEELQGVIWAKDSVLDSQRDAMIELQQTNNQLEGLRTFGEAIKIIEGWPDDMRLEDVEKRFGSLPFGVVKIIVKALRIADAKFEVEDIPQLKAELIEQIIKPLPLVERMAIMLNVSGRVEQKIAVTTEGAHNDLLALMFPELAGFDLIAKLVRSQDGDANLLVGFSAMFPDSKKGRSSFGRRYFNLPIKVDESGALCSRLQAKDYDDLWKVLDKPAREWLEQNISKEEFLRRLKDPQKAVANNLAKLLGKRQAFLEDGSLKFAWDNKSSLLTISAQRDNRTGGVGG